MKHFHTFPTAILVLMWIYTGMDKLLAYRKSSDAFHNQTFPEELATALSYAVPGLELLLVLLLVFPLTRWWGYLGSALLLTVFTTYVGLVWVGAFPRIPCSCAGILNSLGWAEHFFLNLFLVTVATLGLWSSAEKNGQKSQRNPLPNQVTNPKILNKEGSDKYPKLN